MFNFRFLLAGLCLVVMASCEPSTAVQLGSDGKPLPKFYDLSKQDAAAVQYRMLDAVNVMRQNVGASPLRINAELAAAAATHARDMSVQNRPWHFGSDGSSPIDRARRAGYAGAVLGENISETYEGDLETLRAWMAQPDTRAVILGPSGRDLGLGYFQEDAGKIWWVLMVGDSRRAAFGPRG